MFYRLQKPSIPDVPGIVVMTPYFQGSGAQFDPQSGNQDPTRMAWPKTKRKKKIFKTLSIQSVLKYSNPRPSWYQSHYRNQYFLFSALKLVGILTHLCHFPASVVPGMYSACSLCKTWVCLCLRRLFSVRSLVSVDSSSLLASIRPLYLQMTVSTSLPSPLCRSCRCFSCYKPPPSTLPQVDRFLLVAQSRAHTGANTSCGWWV